MKDNKCLDILSGSVNDKVWLKSCHGLAGNQFFAFAKNHQIITGGNYCVAGNEKKKSIFLARCREGNLMQAWDYDKEVIFGFKIFLV